MTCNEALSQLEALGSEKMRAQNRKRGSGDNQFGVMMGDIRKVAQKIKTNHKLGLELWDTGNVDARFLAILIMKPTSLSMDDLNRLVSSERFTHVADWLYSYVIKEHPDRDTLRIDWMKSKDAMAARAG